jgi:hypothetical protein
MQSPSNNATQLAQLLQAARARVETKASEKSKEGMIHVAETGGVLTAAYEQLRNAAEYAEEHLLLQRAIRRFYKRSFLLRDTKHIRSSGQDLVIELTQAGYVGNDTLPEGIVRQISDLAVSYFAAYEAIDGRKDLSRQRAEDWTLDVLSVRVEWLLNDPAITDAYVQFVHGYFIQHHRLAELFSTSDNEVETSLYAAIHRALLKSDNATIRSSLLAVYDKSPAGLEDYIAINKQIDMLLSAPLTEKLYRYVDRKGAPLRVLRHMIQTNDTIELDLPKKETFLSSFSAQVTNEYASITKRINHGIVKSVIFLVITKFLIGIAIEIPYDYLVMGAILWTPLLINLAFPPLYMILLRTTLVLPGEANTRRLTERIEQVLYEPPAKELERKPAASFGIGYNVAYALVFVIVFGGAGYLLWANFHFELLHLFIFFLFLSGASFLGFRLSRMIRELEAVGSDQNVVTTARDFLYMPFVVVGRYMSEKYAQVNIVALSLDMLIELPLKTILRLVRQWGAFISSKKDAL